MTTATATKERKKILRRNRGAVLQMDAIEEILARLPAKHVLRCKILSKTYSDLIRKQSFINKHLLHHQQHSDGSKVIVVSKNLHNGGYNRMVSTLDETESESEVVFVPPTEYLFTCSTPVGSCNGLLVVQLFPDDDDLTVCNPAIREYMPLPRPKLVHMPYHQYTVDALGFGYDAQSGDYKLVKIGDYSREGNNGPCFYMIEIWRMSTNTWKQINPPMPSLFLHKEYEINPHYGLLVKQTLYWLAFAKDKSDRDAVILSFDPTKETFGQIVLPKDVLRRQDTYDMDLIDFEGSLALSIGLPSYGGGGGESSHILFDIWVMMDTAAETFSSSSSWTKKFSIGPFPPDVTTTRVYVGGKFVLRRTVHAHDSVRENWQFSLYDPHHDKVLKESTVDEFQNNTTAWSYNPSLVSLRQT